MNISKVTLEIETSEGDALKFVVYRPNPHGGNTAFMNRQLETAVDELSRRGQKSLEIFGRQYTPADERLDQLRAERNRSDTS